MSDSIHKNKKILIVTDAWYPQVNGVVRTLTHTRDELILKGHDVTMLTPEGFRTIPCPTYPEIRLALFPATHRGSLQDNKLREVEEQSQKASYD